MKAVALAREAVQNLYMLFKSTLPPLLVSILMWSSGCHTVPHTGRSALHLLPTKRLASMASTHFEQLKQETPISRDANYNAMLRRVGERIAYVAAPNMPNAQWEFVVFDDTEQINAFAMPGGKVGVYTGIFKVAKTEDDLAVVVGHEIAHVAAGHGNERASQQLLAAGGAMALQVGLDDMDRLDQQMLMVAYGAGTTISLILPYSRYHESEADEIGLIYAAKAGYDPRAAIGFWERMEAQKKGAALPEFLSTHPSDSKRLRKINALMPKAYEIYKNHK